ncbi:MAG: hypothetical protein M5U26_01795 [Planctomycetota bacterium]|nr:hypothetical protein [Planctomycetota bacterium]
MRARRAGLRVLPLALLVLAPVLRAGEDDPVAQAKAKFLEVVRKQVEAEMTALPPEQVEQAAKELNAKKEELPSKMAAMMLEQYDKHFTPSEDEAKAILAGTFDDEGNAKKVQASLKVFHALDVPLPRMLAVQIDAFNAGKLKGLELEFFARHCLALCERAKQALEKK